MPLLKILSSSEITGFDSPPVFNHEERKKFFSLPAASNPVRLILQIPTNTALWKII